MSVLKALCREDNLQDGILRDMDVHILASSPEQIHFKNSEKLIILRLIIKLYKFFCSGEETMPDFHVKDEKRAKHKIT